MYKTELKTDISFEYSYVKYQLIKNVSFCITFERRSSETLEFF